MSKYKRRKHGLLYSAKKNSSKMTDKRVHLPTQREIKVEAAKIRMGWDKTRWQRVLGLTPHVTVQEIHDPDPTRRVS